MSKHGNAAGEAAGSSSPEPEFSPCTVVALAESKDEARDMFTETQYWEAVLLVKRLTDFGDRNATADLEIRPFGDFYELCLKGGFVKKLNVRIYFAFVSDLHEVVVLKTYKKEEDRRTCPSIMYTLEDRLEDYLDGKRAGISVYRRGSG